jgi:type II secretory pathway pseudopilin PulG
MPNRNQRARLEGGFSLLELLVAMLVAVEVLVAAGMAFDLHNRMAVIQTQVTDLQQSLRISQYDIARLVRMAGRGGLPADFHPEAVFDPGATIPSLGGLAIEVRDNVTDATDRHIARGDTDSPEALEGTDILTVRGCFSNSVYQLQPNAFQPGDSDGDGVSDGNVTFTIDDQSVAGIHQALGPLIEQLGVANSTPTMIFMSPVDRQTYGVGRVTGFTPTSGTPAQMQITVNLDTNSPLNPPIRRGAPYNDIVRGVPANMTAALTCLLEEYRFYIREEHEIPGDDTTPLRPRLTRARFEPGTENAYANDPANFSLDLADGVFDLQVALGLDTDYPATDPTTPGSFDDDLDFDGVDDTIFEGDPGTNARNTDDWLFNSPGDNPDDTQYRIHGFTGRAGQPVQLYFVRITTIARTQRPDPNYQAPDFDATAGSDLVEDHDYDAAPANQFKTQDARKYRRRMLTTIVDMRNI